MKLRVLRFTDREVKLEVEGEGYTFLSALQDIFVDDPRVEFVGYNVPHPLISKATFTLRVTPGNELRDVLKTGVEALKNRLGELETMFLEALKRWENKS
ncbi:DNA-directed RNA polymerase subunit L [Candidatus Bathyarchaeota archaeon]|nr:DNA-directed RNA polymerase subunit L [Candidatus Bathyarchaeota archaeon]